MNVAAHQQREKNEETKTGKEGRRSILKEPCAAPLRSFWGQQGEKMACAKGVPR